jgi:regulatory protein
MPVITDIKRQKRSDTRYSVYLDGAYVFALSDLDLSTSGLRVGQELTEADVQGYQEQGERSKGYGLALRYLGFRSRSRREMRDYLLGKGIETDDVEDVIARLEKAKLIDDQAFATSWVATRQSLRPRSKRVLEQELLVKGVSRDDIAGALSGLDADEELETLVRLAERKQQLPQYREREKLMGYLSRQGYEYGLIKKALERLDE